MRLRLRTAQQARARRPNVSASAKTAAAALRSCCSVLTSRDLAVLCKHHGQTVHQPYIQSNCCVKDRERGGGGGCGARHDDLTHLGHDGNRTKAPIVSWRVGGPTVFAVLSHTSTRSRPPIRNQTLYIVSAQAERSRDITAATRRWCSAGIKRSHAAATELFRGWCCCVGPCGRCARRRR